MYISVNEAYMPPMMLPSVHNNNHTAIIRVKMGDYETPVDIKVKV